MGLTDIPTGYVTHNTVSQVMVMEDHKDAMSSKKKMHILKKIRKRFGLGVRRSPSSCAGPNNLPPLQFHSVHGDNIRISRDGTMARRFESFCRAITFSARPVRINERICVRFTEISNNWNGGIRFGFTTNDPQSLENALPKYACPDLTNRPGFWAKALCEQYCEKDNILYYYVNSAGNVIYGINNEEKGVILTGVDTRGLLWTIIDIYGNCTAIEFLDARIYMYQQNASCDGALPAMAGAQMMGLNPNNPHQQSRRSLPANTTAAALSEQELERHIMPSMQSLNIATHAEHAAIANDLANGLPPLRYNGNGRLIPVPFHITKGRNVRLSHDRFIASRTESDFCQGYVFTARPIRIGEKVIVQILKTEQMYVGALALGLTSCNPATLQPSDLPNDSDFLLDRPEYWVVSKDIASTPQRGDEIAFFVAPNGEVTISKNNGPAVVVMHVDESLQLWAFLDVYGSTQSVRMFRQQLPNMIAYPQQQMPNMAATSTSGSSARLVNVPVSESMNSLNSQLSMDARKMLHPSQLNVTHSTIGASSSTLASSSLQSNALNNSCAAALNTCSTSSSNSNVNANIVPANVTSSAAAVTAATAGRMISVPSSNGDMIQIQPNLGGTVLVVNLPPATSHQALNELNTALSVSQARLNHNNTAIGASTSGILVGACSSGNGMLANVAANSQYIEPVSNGCGKWKDTVDHHRTTNTTTNSTHTESSACGGNNSANAAAAECTICYENPIDSVLYMCGHMCMCYDCALEQWRGVGGGQCPLCRAVIRDVIRTYTT